MPDQDKDLLRLKAEAITKLSAFQTLVMNEVRHAIKKDTNFDIIRLMRDLESGSPEGIALRKAVNDINLYRSLKKLD